MLRNLASDTAAAPRAGRPVIGSALLAVKTCYRAQGANVCPDCGHSSWLVGRKVAECAVCATALPLEQGFRTYRLG